MTKQNKVLEALEMVRKRIETEAYHWRRSDGAELYEAKRINKILLEEINTAIEEGERQYKELKELREFNKLFKLKYGRM